MLAGRCGLLRPSVLISFTAQGTVWGFASRTGHDCEPTTCCGGFCIAQRDLAGCKGQELLKCVNRMDGQRKIAGECICGAVTERENPQNSRRSSYPLQTTPHRGVEQCHRRRKLSPGHMLVDSRPQPVGSRAESGTVWCCGPYTEGLKAVRGKLDTKYGAASAFKGAVSRVRIDQQCSSPHKERFSHRV